MYEEGMRTVDIAVLAGVSQKTVNVVLRRNDVKRRARGSWKRKYQVNEDYFKTWSPTMAYVLGFFAADGCISGQTQTVSFAQNEIEILEDIRDELGSNHRIVKNDETGVYILNIHSKIMKDDLMNIHGMFPAKSNTFNFPDVPDEYLSHFIRGYYDGDGSLYKKTFYIVFVGGSEVFMDRLRQIINSHIGDCRFMSDKTNYRIHISGKKTIKSFLDWIYKNKNIFLKRKFERFIDLYKNLPEESLENRKLKRTNDSVIYRKEVFLRKYRHCFDIQKSCNEAKINYSTYVTWVKNDLDFKAEIETINSK
ncbi:endonuclease [Bacillus sp. H-16]|nr:endonuclease [Alteribacter salitolerans]